MPSPGGALRGPEAADQADRQASHHLGVSEQGAEALGTGDQGAYRGQRRHCGRAGRALEQRHLSDELARPHRRKGFFPQTHEGQPLHHEEQLVTGLTLPYERLARLKADLVEQRCQRGEIAVANAREAGQGPEEGDLGVDGLRCSGKGHVRTILQDGS